MVFWTSGRVYFAYAFVIAFTVLFSVKGALNAADAFKEADFAGMAFGSGSVMVVILMAMNFMDEEYSKTFRVLTGIIAGGCFAAALVGVIALTK